jgi:hypothetical protein
MIEIPESPNHDSSRGNGKTNLHCCSRSRRLHADVQIEAQWHFACSSETALSRACLGKVWVGADVFKVSVTERGEVERKESAFSSRTGFPCASQKQARGIYVHCGKGKSAAAEGGIPRWWREDGS